MKTYLKRASILLMVAVCSSCYIKKEAEPQKTITVTASGVIAESPDTATVDFTVVTTGWSAKQITADITALSTRLTDAIKNVGVSEEDITLANSTISLVGSSYEARRNIRVTVRNLEILSAVVDCKPAGNTVRLSKVEYSISDVASLARRARTTAIQKAQDAASLLAGASGSKIGDVMQIEEEKNATSLTQDGKINVTSDVKITYSLQ